MTEAPEGDQGAGRKTGSLPLGPRRRARNLYRRRRAVILETAAAELKRRYGDRVDVDEEAFQSARVALGDLVLEVGFAGHHRMFGSMIDTQWVALRGVLGEQFDHLVYRFDRNAFVVKRGTDRGLAALLADKTTRTLAARAELKSIVVEDDGASRRVVITPLAGTITAVYFPPLPPYSVLMKKTEVRDHVDLLLHLARIG